MGFEIDFMPVGEGGSSGDAIALRYGDLYGSRADQTVVVIDGGYQESGEKLVEHIREYYKTDVVDLVVSTHPDSDHINGLPIVLEELDVRHLWMHRPSNRSAKLERVARTIKDEGQRKAFREAVKSAQDLEAQAERMGIPITEPFTRIEFEGGMLRVLGPDEQFYEETIEEASHQATVLRRIVTAARKKIKKLKEDWFTETLTDDGETTPNNNTSAVILFSDGESHCLFTADAGIPALERVGIQLGRLGLDGGQLRWIQVPHHGSKRNVGHTLLDNMLGGIKSEGKVIGTAYVSAAPDGEPKHPAKKVTNAFLRRGYPVYVTAGNTMRHKKDAPDRGWSSSQPLSLFSEVEE